ncbi:MAG: hypothetical protein ACM32E_07540 [Gemmatimonadota bacterium]
MRAALTRPAFAWVHRDAADTPWASLRSWQRDDLCGTGPAYLPGRISVPR